MKHTCILLDTSILLLSSLTWDGQCWNFPMYFGTHPAIQCPKNKSGVNTDHRWQRKNIQDIKPPIKNHTQESKPMKLTFHLKRIKKGITPKNDATRKENGEEEQPFDMLPSIYFVSVEWKELQHFISAIPHKVPKLSELILNAQS